MRNKIDYYEQEIKKVQNLKAKVEASLANAPEGKMRCEMAQERYPQYYIQKEPGIGACNQYLTKDKIGIASLYAQKEYDTKVARVLDEKEKILKNLLNLKRNVEVKDVYNQLPMAKRILVNPYELPDEIFIDEWKAKLKGGQIGIPIDNGYNTESGELVRSKSEKMIADKLYMRGIPYVYEAVLVLDNNKHIYPDFTMLNVRTRRTFYLEHMGMMDDPEYCKGAIGKIEVYEKNQIYLGERLLVSMESSLKGINIKQIDSIIDRYLL